MHYSIRWFKCKLKPPKNQLCTTIVSIQDRSVKDKNVVKNVVIFHRHSLQKKFTWERYYCESEFTNIGGDFFTRLFYKPTQCYVQWPGESVVSSDHRSDDAMYCI